ncbi:MAG: ABC transporter ATP-binding protein [Ignavibacteria bacterium]|nr:ABC transporter ATP-binding protein [Ignavibacteria bacterium]
MENILYRLGNVKYKYSEDITALDGITLDIPGNKISAFAGTNGCGKTTLLYILNGLIFPSEGNVFYNDTLLEEKILSDTEFVRKFRSSNGLIFQDSDAQLFCSNVYEELTFGPKQLELDKAEISSRIESTAELLGITPLLKRSVSKLSGGEKKKVAIASVLTLNPSVLLMDEPTAGLDPKSQGILIDIIFELAEAGKTIIISTHDLGLIDDLKPLLFVMNESHQIESTGNTEDILADEELLYKVNLIHEHVHLHDGERHRHIHSHYKIHQHNSVKK